MSAQENRPSVGLVLSGGGAHGIAHLGVIKVMEEAGLRPDYITGVSMGSIIGGMYSIGYNYDSIYSILKKIDWELILSNRIEENKVIYPEKNTFHNSIITLPFSSRKVNLPSGLINGQMAENTLGYYLWPAADISDFSKLPIPFMCVATDIIPFRKVDLKGGYLPDAIRASFAVPSIFTPIKIDTMLLADGGLIRNFAATEAIDMGAQIIVGSYTGFRPYPEEELRTLPGILKQIALSRSSEDFEEQKKNITILITPETKRYPITGFENIDSLVKAGYDAALPYRNDFKKLADSLNLIGKQQPVKNILEKKYYEFDKIEIDGNNIYSDDQVRGILDIEPGSQVNRDLIYERIELLYGRSWFEKVKYRIIPRNDSLILVIECEEKPRGIIYGSVHYDNTLRAGIWFGISAKNILTRRSVLNLNSYIAQYFRVDLNANQYINRNQKLGFSLNFYADNTLIPMLDSDGEKADYISRNFIPSAAVNRTIGLNQMMTLSLKYENTNLIPQSVSDDHLKRLSNNYLTAAYEYNINSLDEKYFPGKGTLFTVSVSASKLLSQAMATDTSRTVIISGDNDFKTELFYCSYARIRHFFSPAQKVTFSLEANALIVTNTDSVSVMNNFFMLGGIESVNRRSIPLIGYHTNEIPVRMMAGISGDIDIELFRDIYLEMAANAAAIDENGDNNGYKLVAGYGLGVGYMSVIGPLRIGIMHGNSSSSEYFNKIKGYISIGYKF